MKKLASILVLSLLCIECNKPEPEFIPYTHSSRDIRNLENNYLVYHKIITDQNGKIIPWCNPNFGCAYDSVISLCWKFWINIRRDDNGLPYYMNHQIYREGYNDHRGIGGDQFQAALESWRYYYGYTGDENVLENAKFIADYYITHSLSPAHAAWPNVPHPYNTKVYSGIYDGDMILGKGYFQPDKAGAFGFELLQLFKATKNEEYLKVAIGIANTLASKTSSGDENNSPLPFKVNTETGEIGVLKDSETGQLTMAASYTTAYSGLLSLFEELIRLQQGNTIKYQQAYDKILDWMKKYPMQNMKWGPYFEDVSGWSNTQVNAVNWTIFMMSHPHLFPNWKSEVKAITDWIYQEFGNTMWAQFGVKVINEQTCFMYEGSSHSAHQASSDLMYATLSGDSCYVENAIRMLNWATYMVDFDGKNQYPVEAIWMTDGYGDYIRHYLRSMSVWPSLAPDNANHLIHTTSVIQRMDYYPNMIWGHWEIALSKEDLTKNKKHWPQIYYVTYDSASTETFRLVSKPVEIIVNSKPISESDSLEKEGWTWQPLAHGGVLRIKHTSGNRIQITM